MMRIAILIPLSLLVISSSSLDTLTTSESLNVSQTLVSAGQKYELGFFVPPGGDAGSLYLGIWYYNLPVKTYVWVANRATPARRNSSPIVKFGRGGGRVVLLAEQGVIWSSNETHAANPVLQLLDTGNLVIREADNTDHYLWESFDYPTDTLLPSQKLGWDKKSGLDRRLISWKSSSDPSLGNYSFMLNLTGDPELFLLNDNTKRIYRSGPLVGVGLSGVPAMKPSTGMNFTLPDTQDEIYYMFSLVDQSIRSRLVAGSDGFLYRYTWVPDLQKWNQFWYLPMDPCDWYMACGPYGVCNADNIFVCGCPQGFSPRNPVAWGLRDGSDGCVRRTRVECASDGFELLGSMKLPASGAAVVDREKGLEECKEMCKRDCNCTAYANAEVVDGVGSGCVMWTGDLLDMRSFLQGGQDLYIRLAAIDLRSASSVDSNKTKKATIAIGISVATFALLIATAASFAWKAKNNKSANRDQIVLGQGTSTIPSKRDISIHNDGVDDLDVPLYDFDAIATATNNFSEENKLGEGGFGCVYKGVLNEGEEIAIKRLSNDSGQGAEEFKNEVKLIAKLQHRNLVRLLGFCAEGEEKMLIYEYLHNRSLDLVLFHQEKCSLLDWQMRFNIICGIARGLLYLHQDSRLRIIHRDLKASNILLDNNMNSKISDFGMARIFIGDEAEANRTRRIVGTYGYMSPEYAMDGVFSTKSDVFSFGVLVLEIVTGRKNRAFCNTHQELNLLGYAWKLWNEGKGMELLHPSIGDSYRKQDVLRCIRVGLLCVQARPEERPTMSSVVLLLSSEAGASVIPLPQPQLQGFYLGWRPVGDSDSSAPYESFSINQVTVTMIDGR